MSGKIDILRKILPQLAYRQDVICGPGDDCAVSCRAFIATATAGADADRLSDNAAGYWTLPANSLI